jgi:hypothetical protein
MKAKEKRWGQKPNSMEGVSIIKEVKVLRGPYSQGVRKYFLVAVLILHVQQQCSRVHL